VGVPCMRSAPRPNNPIKETSHGEGQRKVYYIAQHKRQSKTVSPSLGCDMSFKCKEGEMGQGRRGVHA
jgi:hypothetical protein